MMGTPYTGNPASNPASITLPDDGDAKNVASVNPALAALADQIASRGIALRFANTGAMAANTTALNNGDLVEDKGADGVWEYYAAGTPFTPDGRWIVAATGLGGPGQYIRLGWSAANGSGFAGPIIAAMGTVPGGFLTAADNTIPYISANIVRAKHTLVQDDGLNRFHRTSQGLWVQGDLSSTGYLTGPLDVPHNSHLQSATVYLRGQGGHGVMPATRPAISIVEFDLSAGTATQISAAPADGSANVAAYETYHTITVNVRIDNVTPLNWAIDHANKHHVIMVSGEFGAGAATGLQIWGVSTVSTVTEQDKG